MKVAGFCGVALALGYSIGHAAEIRVMSGACGEPVRLVARDVPLSLVLKRLGDSLGFTLAYQSQHDPLITRDLRATSVDLVRELASGLNYSVEQIADRRCPRGNRVAKVSVLSD